MGLYTIAKLLASTFSWHVFRICTIHPCRLEMSFIVEQHFQCHFENLWESCIPSLQAAVFFLHVGKCSSINTKSRGSPRSFNLFKALISDWIWIELNWIEHKQKQTKKKQTNCVVCCHDISDIMEMVVHLDPASSLLQLIYLVHMWAQLTLSQSICKWAVMKFGDG